MVSIRLPWPPTVNTYWKPVIKAGHAVLCLSRQGEEFRKAAVVAARNQGVSARRVDGPVSVTIAAYPPNRRRRDVDNILKATLDAITHIGIWDDDSQVETLYVRRMLPEAEARVEIDIEEIRE